MRHLLLIIIVGAACFIGIPICCAGDLIPEVSPSQVHLQMVNQELDKMESSGNDQAPAALPVSDNQVSAPVPVPNNQIAAPSGISYRRYELGFGQDLYWARYQQPKNFHQNGYMSGYDVLLTYRNPPNSKSLISMYRLEGQWAQGKFDNRSNDGTISLDGIKDNTYEIRGLAGKDFYPLSSLRLTGYSGFGYRYLKDDPRGLTSSFPDPTIPDQTDTSPAYETVSHYCYIPFGADIFYQKNRQYSLDSNFEFDYMVRGWEVSKLGVLLANYNTTVNTQTGIGLRASLRLNLYFRYFNAYAETFFRYWSIGRSNNLPDPIDPVNNPPLNIPKNNTEEFGLKLGLEA